VGRYVRLSRLALLLLLSATSGHSQTTYTWIGGGGLWTTNSNWSPLGVPGSVDTVIIDSGSCVLNVSTTVTDLTISSTGALAVSGTRTLTVRGDVDVSGTGSIATSIRLILTATAADVTLTQGSSFTIGGDVEINASNTVRPGSDLTIGGDLDVVSGSINIDGFTVNVGGSVLMDTGGGGLTAGNANLNIGDSFSNTGGTFDEDTATITMTGSGTITTDAWPPGANFDFYNLVVTGDVTANTGVIVENACTIDGTLTTDGTQGLVVFGDLTGTGSLVASGSDLVRVEGDFTVSSFTPASSTATLTGTTSPVDLAGLTFNNLTINKGAGGNIVNSTGGLTVGGTLTMTQGTWNAGSFTHAIAGPWVSTAGNFTFNADTSNIQLTSNPNITTKGLGQPFYDLTLNSGGTALSAIRPTARSIWGRTL
jgi:fibronectin-binding autotransporter adhesin